MLDTVSFYDFDQASFAHFKVCSESETLRNQWRPVTGTATGPLGRLVSPSAMAPKLGVGPSLPSHQMGPALTPLSHKSAATCARIAGLSGCHLDTLELGNENRMCRESVGTHGM